MNAALLAVRNLRKYFSVEAQQIRRGEPSVQAVDGVSFAITRARRWASSANRAAVNRRPRGCSCISSNRMTAKSDFAGRPVVSGDGLSARELRRQMQMVFQDSYASLNPRLARAGHHRFRPHGARHDEGQGAGKSARAARTREARPDQFGRRYPHELSGGQRQRINFARALALDPRLVILDEPVSALDKSIEAQVLNLLMDLKKNLQLTYLFISHDLSVVQYVSDRVLVMYLGKVVEFGPVDELYHRPRHPYTQALLASRPSMDPDPATRALTAHRRPAEPDQSAFGLPLPHPLRLRGSRLRAGRAAPARIDTAHSAACHMVIPDSGHSKQAVSGKQ